MNNATIRRIYYLDILKIISCLAVIFLHVSAQNFNILQPSTFTWQVCNFYDSCVRFSVPVFVMISGALFLEQNKKDISLKKLYTKNILRLVIAYIFYTIFYAVFKFYLTHHTLNFKVILKNAILNSNYHLWFVPMLIGIYVLIPILKKITENSTKEEIQYLLMIFFICNILKNTINSFSFPVSEYINAVFSRFSVDLFIGYFLLGYYINTYPIKKRNRFTLYIIGGFCLIVCIVGNSLYSLASNKPTQYFYSNFFITTFFISIAVFIFAKYVCSKIQINNLVSKVIINLSNASFGIYLIHVFMIDLLFYFHFDITMFNPIFSIPFISLIIFSGSLVIINIIKKIPYFEKYIT